MTNASRASVSAMLLALAVMAAPASAERRAEVAFLVGHGEASPGNEMSAVAEALSVDYDVSEIDLSALPDGLAGVRVLVIAGDPDIPDAQLYQVDQYLMRGGRALFLLDAARLPRSGLQANLSEANIFGFLKAYGVVVNPDLVLDRQCAPDARWRDVATDDPYPYWPLVPREDIADDGPFAEVQSIQFAFTSSITTPFEMPGRTRADVLASSSSQSWTVSAYANLDPAGVPPPGVRSSDVLRTASTAGFRLIVSVVGEFQSAFLGKKLVVQTGRHVDIVEPVGIIEHGAPTALIVFGGSTMFRDVFVRDHAESVPFLVRAVDWLAREEIQPSGLEATAKEPGGRNRGGVAPRTRGAALWILSIGVLAVLFVTATLIAVRRGRSARR